MNTYTTKLAKLGVLVMLVTCVGCTRHSIQIKNSTPTKISDAYVEIGSAKTTATWVAVDRVTTEMIGGLRIPKKCIVAWTTETGESHSVTVTIPKECRSGTDGVISFEILPDKTIKVSLLPW